MLLTQIVPAAALLAQLLFALAAFGTTASAATDAATLLQAQRAALAGKFAHSPFQRPLYLDSTETSSAIQGEVYAVLDYPFATFGAALNSAAHWCDVMILHLNVKYCHAAPGPAAAVVTVSIGRKYDQPLADAYPVEFAYRVEAARRDYFAVQLRAETGPLSTRDYRIHLEAGPAEGRQTFVHFTYSYAYGFAGRLAMATYLATVGRGKVGFTIIGTKAAGQPEHIGGMRGVVERNTMRYYLAIEAYLGALAAPPADQLELRLANWFAATERYGRQLHEVGRSEYLEMKRKEYLRQQAVQ